MRLRLLDPPGVPAVVGEDVTPVGGGPSGVLKLRERGGGLWEGEAALPAQTTYRLAVLDPDTGAPGDDEGFARRARASALARDPDGRRVLEQAWRATLVRFVCAHRLASGRRLAVVGDGPALGAWRRPQPLEPVEEGRWAGLIALGEPYGQVAYRYVVLDGRPRWEREPNREVGVPPPREVTNGLVETVDVNVVTGLDLDWVTDTVAVGPYPQGPDDAARLAEAGVTAVLNVQTDDDLRRRGLHPGAQAAMLEREGLVSARVPIVDFDAEDLTARLPEATARLEALLSAGHRVYVHCTAGMGRSPAVVVAHLVGRGAGLGEAARLVGARRPESAPNLDAVARGTAGRRGG